MGKVLVFMQFGGLSEHGRDFPRRLRLPLANVITDFNTNPALLCCTPNKKNKKNISNLRLLEVTLQLFRFIFKGKMLTGGLEFKSDELIRNI